MEKKINKRKIVIQGLFTVTMLGVGYYFGVKAGAEKLSDALTSVMKDGVKYI